MNTAQEILWLNIEDKLYKIEEKTCSKCENAQPLSCFAKRKDSKDGYRNRCKTCMPKYKYEVIDNGPIICTTCEIEKPFAEFYLTLDNICKECHSIKATKYRTTLNGALRELMNSAKSRVKDIEGDRGLFDLTFEYMTEMYERQQGLCHYSKIEMTFQGAFKMSLERRDNDKGYIESNVALICLEFNIENAQWSLQKVSDVITILDKKITENYVNFERKRTCVKKDTPYDKKEYYESPRAKIKSLFTSAKHRIIKKNKKDANYGFDIDFEFLVDMFNAQKGLCAYSGIPMQFKGDWLISLERIDVYKGYLKDNVCFICLEYNSIDRTVNKKTKTETSTAWSKEKFEFFLKTIRESDMNEMLQKASI